MSNLLKGPFLRYVFNVLVIIHVMYYLLSLWGWRDFISMLNLRYNFDLNLEQICKIQLETYVLARQLFHQIHPPLNLLNHTCNKKKFFQFFLFAKMENICWNKQVFLKITKTCQKQNHCVSWLYCFSWFYLNLP
jgi:hypothetical protein